MNFDSGRNEKRPVLHLKVEPAMSQSDLAKLSLDADPLVRTGNDKVETADFSDISFTPRRLSLKATAKDVGFQVRALLTIGATFGALYALWESNPAWGDAGSIASLVALVGVGLAAVGVRAIMNPSTTPGGGG